LRQLARGVNDTVICSKISEKPKKISLRCVISRDATSNHNLKRRNEMQSIHPIITMLFTITCTTLVLPSLRADEPITLIGTIVKWRYPDAEIGKSEMSDAATADASGKRTTPSSILKTTMKTDDSVEKVVAFYKDLLARTPEKDEGIGIGGQAGASVVFSDESDQRKLGFHTILVNTQNQSTILIVTRSNGESKTHITWKQYVKHEAAKESRPEALVGLLQLRHDVLEKRLTAIQRRIEDGSLPQEHLYSARDELLKAKLDLASTHQERRDLCKLRVANLESFENLIKSQVKSGEKPMEEQLLATAARLEVEIECLQADGPRYSPVRLESLMGASFVTLAQSPQTQKDESQVQQSSKDYLVDGIQWSTCVNRNQEPASFAALAGVITTRHAQHWLVLTGQILLSSTLDRLTEYP
jgi:hypothetical protein